MDQGARASQGHLDGSGAFCLICGAGPFVLVGQHARQIHGVPSREYRKRFPDAAMTGADLTHAWRLELAERGIIGGAPRQRYCKRGHSLSGANVIRERETRTGVDGTPWADRRRCRKCRNASKRLPPPDPVTCATCGGRFQPRSQGRPPTYCPECRRERDRASWARYAARRLAAVSVAAEMDCDPVAAEYGDNQDQGEGDGRD
jgi:hypothetical protein